MPQGTLLRPLLFLTFINDLPSRVNSKARLFADDCLLYRSIKTEDDVASLQDNLTSLQKWEKDRQMHFKKVNRKVQEEPHPEAAANPRYQEEEKN